MASIIKADNGVLSGVTGIVQTADSSGQLALQTTSSGGTATTALTIDNSQNVGLGVTPSAWGTSGTTAKAIQFPTYGSIANFSDSSMHMVENAYWTGSGWTYLNGTAASATKYTQSIGAHYWYYAGAGTGAVSFTQAMTLDNSGNLGLATSSVTPRDSGATTLELYGPSSGRAAIKFTNSTSGTTGTDGMFLGYDSSLNFNILNNESGAILFGTNNTERARIDSSGNLGLGVTPASWSGRTAFQIGTAGQMNYGSGISNGGSMAYGNNGYWNGSADKAITTGYSQIVALNDNGTGRVIILTTSGTSSAGASISYTAGPYVSAGNNSWTNSSDERLKNITGLITNGLESVNTLRAARYTWKDDLTNKPKVGLIAQDVQKVLPEAVETFTKYNSEDTTEYLGVTYTEVIPLLVAAIQELSAELTALKAKVGA